MRYRSIRRLAGTGIVVGGLTMSMLVGGISAGAVTHTHGAAVSVLKVAEPPGTKPSSILPYYTGGQCYTINIDYWNLQYRPGYWFGLGNSITEQAALSSFNAPHITTAGGKTTATFTTKPWIWSSKNVGGISEVQDAQMVAFWLNMDRAESAATAKGGSSNTDSCGYSPGLGIPDNIASVSYPKGLVGNEVVIKFNTSFSSSFMLYNQLSQIQPMPVAWDVTSAAGKAGSGHCSSEAFSHVKILHGDACTKVFTFLSKLKMNSKLWDWSDGPYRQSSFGYSGATPNGINVQIANTLYSGPVKAKAVKTISYVPFVSETAEQGQLQSNKLDLGYLDPSDVTTSPGPGKAGNITLPKMSSYKAVGTVTFGVFYWNVNFGTSFSTNQTGVAAVDLAELNQTYFRQAIQESINQPGVISHVDNGYATLDYSAIPTYPANPFLAGVHNPFPFNTSAAASLMQANGWNTSTTPAKCTSPGSGAGECGAGIPLNANAEVTLETPGGDPAVTEQVNEEVATIGQAGIQLDLNTQDQNTVGGVCFAGQTSGDGLGGWDLCNYGGWIFAPDYYPSGEVLFLPGAGSNDGGLNDPTMNGLIHQTDFGTLALNGVSSVYHTSYAQYSAQSVPFIWQPTPAGFGIDIKTLKGAQPPNALNDFNPEYISAI
jgi:peptide/nickel transport system substrate-binding protein